MYEYNCDNIFVNISYENLANIKTACMYHSCGCGYEKGQPNVAAWTRARQLLKRKKPRTRTACRGSRLAGMAGFEPANDGVKVRCLTPWLHPNIQLAVYDYISKIEA